MSFDLLIDLIPTSRFSYNLSQSSLPQSCVCFAHSGLYGRWDISFQENDNFSLTTNHWSCFIGDCRGFIAKWNILLVLKFVQSSKIVIPIALLLRYLTNKNSSLGFGLPRVYLSRCMRNLHYQISVAKVSFSHIFISLINMSLQKVSILSFLLISIISFNDSIRISSAIVNTFRTFFYCWYIEKNIL